VTTWVGTALFIGLAVAIQFDGPWEPSTLLLGLAVVALAASFPGMTSGYIDLFDDAVVIDGLLRRRRVVPLTEIQDVGIGRYGLYFRTGEHAVVSGPGGIGAKGLGLKLLKVQTRGDRIAARVTDAAADARARSA
jgi:hypothetical protein